MATDEAAPATLNERHRKAALLQVVAPHLKTKEIAEIVGLSPGRLAVLRASPLYQALLAEERERMRNRAHGTVAAEFTQRFPKAMATLDAAMDMIDDPKTASVAVKAAIRIIDQEAPPKQVQERTEDIRVRVTLEDRRYMERVLAEDDGAIDVTPAAPAAIDVIDEA